MQDPFTWLPIEKKGRRGGAPESSNPIPPVKPKAKISQDVKEVRPIHRVKGLRNIQFNE
jgi:hypothetical protein